MRNLKDMSKQARGISRGKVTRAEEHQVQRLPVEKCWHVWRGESKEERDCR